MNAPKPVIQIENGYKSWHLGKNKIDVLCDINLCVYKGESLAIMGPSGAGKSTLLHTLGLLTFLEKGSIRFENEIIPRHGPNRLTPIRSLIGLIFQDAKLIPELTVLDNVCLPLAHRGVWPFKQKKIARNELSNVGLTNRLYHRPNQLSGGELIRTAIARALVQKPRVLLADEPTGNLDSKTSKMIADLILNTVSPDRALVLVTHNTELAKRANRIVNIKDGKLEST